MAGCILRKDLCVDVKGVFYLQLRKIIQTPDFPSKRNPHLRTKPLEQRRQELENYVQVAHLGACSYFSSRERIIIEIVAT